MSLLSQVSAPASVEGDYRGLVTGLRDALYAYLSSETIAHLSRNDLPRARREISAALEMLLRSPAFSYVVPNLAERATRDVLDMILGLGPIEGLLSDPEVTEIMVNSADSIFFERRGRIEKSDASFFDDEQIRVVIDRIVSPLGRRVDEQSPMVSARLPQGHRVNVIIPPLALDGPVLTIRKFREKVFTLAELVSLRSLDEHAATLLSWAVRMRKSIAVSGGTGGGKTTLLNALSCEVDPSERIITIEDAAELRFLHHPHLVRLEARAANAEGRGEVTIRDLVINALRMRPDRIIVGECRGGEALDMLQAMNTGHEGSMTTLHAGSAHEAVARLVMMSRYAMDLPVQIIEQQIASAIDLVVQQDRNRDGSRRVTSITSCDWGDGGLQLEPVLWWDRQQGCYLHGASPDWLEELPSCGVATREEVQRWKDGVRFL